MNSSPGAQQPTPERIFATFTAYQQTEALQAAIELDLFTGIGEGKQTIEQLALHCQASERGIRILGDYLALMGFLTKDGGRYALAPDAAAFLDRRSPAYFGSAGTFLNSPMLTRSFAVLTAAVRKGGTAADELGSVAPEHPVWVDFARAMAPMMAMPAELLAGLLDAAGRPGKVLDVAAGHGLFGIALARQNPQTVITALDWPAVLAVAEENARAAGVSERYRLLPGSAFEVDYGTGYDLVLLTNFLHHFDVPTCEGLLRKVHAALAPGGRAAALEFVPNDDRVSPPGTAGFSLIMLATTPAGDAYTFAEFDRMFRTAGFSATEFHPLPPSPEQVVIAHR
jgi:ubiquinone/menaquinone biosynthesis C-methylase UbiE